MSEISNSPTLATILHFKVDLANGLTRTVLRFPIMTMDDQAHTFEIEVMRGGQAQELDGATVSAYFVRSDGVTVPIVGSAEGNVATVTLSAACYRVEGRAQLVIKAASGGVISAIFWADGAVASSQTDALLDSEDIIPSLDDLLAQIAAAEAATDAANEAAEAANSAASSATQAAESAGNWGNATASVSMLSSSESPSVTLTDTGSGKVLSFELPIGPTPQLSIGEVATGAPGTQASATLTGTPEQPVLNMTIPQGATGQVENLTVNGTPVVAGNIEITAETVGAIPATEQAATVQDVIDLVYPIGSIYMSMAETSPAVLFGGEWEAIEGRFLLASGANDAAGDTGGARTHTLTKAELPAISLTTPGEPATSTPAWSDPYQAVVYRFMAGTPQGSVSIPLGGSGQAFSVMPPYLAVHVWKRTA